MALERDQDNVDPQCTFSGRCSDEHQYVRLAAAQERGWNIAVAATAWQALKNHVGFKLRQGVKFHNGDRSAPRCEIQLRPRAQPEYQVAAVGNIRAIKEVKIVIRIPCI